MHRSAFQQVFIQHGYFVTMVQFIFKHYVNIMVDLMKFAFILLPPEVAEAGYFTLSSATFGCFSF